MRFLRPVNTAVSAVLCALALPSAAMGETLVSLGDSFSSGEGTSFYDGPTGGPGGCHRSYLAWPRLLGVAKSNHLACSGAVIANLHDGHPAKRPDSGLGQIEVLQRLASDTRFDRVLMTMGGNDVKFASRVAHCYVADFGCLNNLGDIREDLEELRPVLAARYREIVDVADAPLLVVGYPNIVPAGGARVPFGCWASKRSRARASLLIASLDATFRAAAADATDGARHPVDFVSIAGALRSHELCMRERSWVYPVSAVGGDQRAAPDPNGQWAMAKAVQAWLDAHRGSCTASNTLAAIIDDSGSMEESDPEAIRRRAVELLLSKPAAHDRTLGAVEFAGSARELFPPSLVSEERSGMLAALDALRNDGIGEEDEGGTDYNAAFRESALSLPGAGSRIFLTDGAHNASDYEDLHAGGPPTYVIGLNIGPDGVGDEDADRLGRIAGETGGVYYPLRLQPDDSPLTQVGRLQGVVNEIDAKLACSAGATTAPVTLTAPNRRSATVGNLIRPGQPAVEIVISWGTEAADVDLGGVSIRTRTGRVIADLDGTKPSGAAAVGARSSYLTSSRAARSTS